MKGGGDGNRGEGGAAICVVGGVETGGGPKEGGARVRDFKQCNVHWIIEVAAPLETNMWPS